MKHGLGRNSQGEHGTGPLKSRLDRGRREATLRFPFPQLVQEFGRDLPDEYGVGRLLHELVEKVDGLRLFRRLARIQRVDVDVRVSGVHAAPRASGAAPNRATDSAESTP